MNNPSSVQHTNPEAKAGIRKTVLGLLLFITVLIVLLVFRVTRPVELSAEQLRTMGAITFDQPRSFSAVGLQDQHGKPFDFASIDGKWALLFFGFTYCPDICPTTLATMRAAYQELDSELQATTQMVFVSVDPARDTPEKLAQYMDYFGASFIGLRGEFLDLQRFATALNTPFNKVPGGGEDYLIDHGGNIVLLNPRGDYHGFIKPPFEPQRLQQLIAAMHTSFAAKYGEG